MCNSAQSLAQSIGSTLHMYLFCFSSIIDIVFSRFYIIQEVMVIFLTLPKSDHFSIILNRAGAEQVEKTQNLREEKTTTTTSL